MSIKIGGTDISRIYKGTTPINKIYAGDKLVFSRYENAIDNYASIVNSLGGNGQDAINLYNTIPNEIRSNAKIILMPFTVETGVVYAMDNVTGELVPFNFSRASSATLFNKDKDMQLVGNNIPRIDYGNYTDDVKLLVEKESTNLIANTWTAEGGSVNSDPLMKFTESVASAIHRVYSRTLIPNIGNNYTASILLKKYNRRYLQFRSMFAVNSWMMVDLDNKSVTQKYNADGSIHTIGDYVRIDTRNTGSSLNDLRLYVCGSEQPTSATRNITYQGVSDTGFYFGYPQIESGLESTSIIHTTSATRAADQLTYTLSQNSSVYLKTNKRETTLNKNAGLWNIHEDLNNEGIQILAII